MSAQAMGLASLEPARSPRLASSSRAGIGSAIVEEPLRIQAEKISGAMHAWGPYIL